MAAPTAWEKLWTGTIEPRINPLLTRLDTWEVPYKELKERVSSLALPQLKLLAFVAIITSPASSLMVMSAGLGFFIEPLILNRYPSFRKWFDLPDRLNESAYRQTYLENLGGALFNYKEPEIKELEMQGAQIREQIASKTSEALTTQQSAIQARLAQLQDPKNAASVGSQLFIFTASIIITSLLPSLLLYPLIFTIGAFIGDHLYWTALRSPSHTEAGAAPVYYDELLAKCRPKEEASAEEPSESEEAIESSYELSFSYVWSLISPYAEPLTARIESGCNEYKVPLIPLIQKIYSNITPKIKLYAAFWILIGMSPALTLPYAAVLVTSIWFIIESLCKPVIPPKENGETQFEGMTQFFDNRAIDCEREMKKNRAALKILDLKHASNLRSIERFNTSQSRAKGSIGGDFDQAMVLGRNKCLEENEAIEGAQEAIGQRNTWLEENKGDVSRSYSVERQAALFAVAYMAARILGGYWLYFGATALTGGVFLGNHIYHWALREEGWEKIG